MHSGSELVILTCDGGVFGQHMSVWKSMDVGAIARTLAAHGVRSRQLTFEEVARAPELVRNSLVFYSSTQRPGYRDFIEDVLLMLQHGNNRLLPSFDMFRAHENKGYQELLKRLKGMVGIRGGYFSTAESARQNWTDWPAVLKWPHGAKSRGVTLVHSHTELRQAVQRWERLPLADQLRRIYRKLVAPKAGAAEWFEYIKPRQRFVLQEFVSALTHDYKVLVFAENFFVLKRNVRRNDFRASGSGDFSFVDPPASLLDFAASVFDSFGEPFLSLDICATGNGFGLIEFQGVHFGPYTLVESPFHFRRARGEWLKVEQRSVLEEQVALAIVQWLRGAGLAP